MLALCQAPVAALLLPTLAALGTHLCLALLEAGGAGVEATFRVTFYALGSTAAVAAVPMCGAAFFLLWYIPVTTLGLCVVHRSGLFPVLGAVVLSSLLAFSSCCGTLIASGHLAGMIGLG